MTKQNQEEPMKEEEEKSFSPAELINEQLIQKTKEAESYKDKYFRALAEMENTKTRLMQEKKDLISYSIGNIVEDLLGPIDNLENALNHTSNLSPEMQNWAIGFKMILDQFKASLEGHGVVSFDSLGKPFDPSYHQAIELVETSDHEDGTVIQELMKGYKQGKRVIRVAQVKVAKNVSHEDK